MADDEPCLCDTLCPCCKGTGSHDVTIVSIRGGRRLYSVGDLPWLKCDTCSGSGIVLMET